MSEHRNSKDGIVSWSGGQWKLLRGCDGFQPEWKIKLSWHFSDCEGL